LKTIFRSLLVFLCLSLTLSGCYYPRMFRFHSAPGDRSCRVEAHEKRAVGSCATGNSAEIPFELWSATTVDLPLLAQGLNSDNRIESSTYGLRVNGVEQGPGNEHWKQLLRDPKMLCNEACGSADWLNP
jgi:hypothetical protein